jgi:hypothetical protein
MGKKRGPMSQETKDKIKATWDAKKQTPRVPVKGREGLGETEPVEGEPLGHEPTIPQGPKTERYGIALAQPRISKARALEFRGISIEQQRAAGFKEPAFDGLYWKPHHENVNEYGWTIVKMSDGSYNIIAHKGTKVEEAKDA